MFESLASLFVYVLILIEIFINMPINGIYRLPGITTKDNIIIIGGLLSCIISFILSIYIPLPLCISIPILIFYMYTYLK